MGPLSYQSRERKRLAEYARRTWQVKGHVLPYKVAAETLHESVRETALAYFAKHNIKECTRPPDAPLQAAPGCQGDRRARITVFPVRAYARARGVTRGD